MRTLARIEADIAALVGADIDAARTAAHRYSTAEHATRIAATPCPYGDGTTSVQVARLLDQSEVADLLRIDEPAEPMAWPR